jgi:hypothetical protein
MWNFWYMLPWMWFPQCCVIYSVMASQHTQTASLTHVVCCCIGFATVQCSSYSDWLWAGWLRGRSLSPSRVKNFLLSMSPRPALGATQPPIEWVAGAVSLGARRPGREADHSPPTSAKVKKTWIYTSTPSYVFMA